MFSSWRKAGPVVVWAIAMGTAMGCSLKINDPVRAVKPQSLTGDLETCLSSYQGVFRSYFAGSLEAGRMNRLLGCFGTALQLFQDNFRGESSAGFGKEKLKTFLEKTFLKKQTIDREFFEQAMKLKQAVLGGSPDVLSAEEISRTRALIGRLGPPLDELRRAFPLDFESIRGRAPAEIEARFAQLEEVAAQVGEAFSIHGQYYELSDLSRLVDAFLRVAYPDRGWTGLFGKALSSGVVQRLKEAFVSSPGAALTPGDWKLVFKVAARMFGVVARANVILHSSAGYESAEVRNLSTQVVTKAVQVLRESIRTRTQGEIPLLEFSEILWDMKRFQWVEFPDTFGTSPEDFSRSMFLFWSGVTHATTGTAFRVLNEEVLSRFETLSVEFHRALEVLAPHWPLSTERLAGFTPGQIDQATQAVEMAGSILAEAFRRDGVGQEFLDLPTLVSLVVPSSLRDRVDYSVVQLLRRLILPGAQSGVRPGDWSRLFQVAAKVWALGVRFQHVGGNTSPWSENPNLGVVTETLHRMADVVSEIANQQPGQKITLDQIAEILSVAQGKGWLSLPATLFDEPGVVENLKIFAGLIGKIRSRDFLGGLTADGIQNLVRLFDQWAVGQRDFLAARERLGRLPASADRWTRELGASETGILLRRLGVQHRGWGDGIARVGWWDQGISFPGSLDLDADYVEAMKNASFLLMRMVDGFGSPATQANYSGMTLVQLNDAYRYIEPALGALGLVRSSNLSLPSMEARESLAVAAAPYFGTSGLERLQKIFPYRQGIAFETDFTTLRKDPSLQTNGDLLEDLIAATDVSAGALRRWREISIFTAFSQPFFDPERPTDGRVSDPPMISLLSGAIYLVGWGGAARQANAMLADFAAENIAPDRVPAEYFLRKIVEAEFLQKHWGRRYPEWVQFVAGLNPARKAEVAQALARIAFGTTVGNFDAKGSLWVMHMIVQFIETLFARFDVAPKDGVLRLPEIDAAFPIYETELRRMLIEQRGNPDHARLLMGFVLNYGRKPTVAEWLFWNERSLQNVQGRRFQVVQVFGMMSERTAQESGLKVSAEKTSSEKN